VYEFKRSAENMRLPLSIAHGEGFITLAFVGFPAGLIGVVCLIVPSVLAAKKKEQDHMTVRILAHTVVAPCSSHYFLR
jgi:hypothetical protein